MAVNNKSIDNMMLTKALEDIADGMSYLSASNVYNISVNELKQQFLKKYMVHVKPTKTEVEDSVLTGNELKPHQMEYFIIYISHTLLGTGQDVKYDFVKETQKWDLDSTQRKTLWKNLRTKTESSMQKLLENGDCPEYNLSDTLWQCFDYYMVHNMPLYQKLFGSYGDDEKQMRALIHLFNLVGKHRVENLNDAPVEVRIKCWINIGLDYMKKGHVCSLMLLQRRWHEMKLCARMYFLEYWSVFRRVREKADGQEVLHRPKYLHINIAVKYPHVMLKELQSWTRTRKDGGVITMDQFDNDVNYKRIKETFRAIRKTVINFKDVKDKQEKSAVPEQAPKSELVIRPIKKTSDENKKNDDDDDVVMIEDDLPIKPSDDLRGIVIENIMSSGDNTITVRIPQPKEVGVKSPAKVVKSENPDDILIENDGPEYKSEGDGGKPMNMNDDNNGRAGEVRDDMPSNIKREPEDKVDDSQEKQIKMETNDEDCDVTDEVRDRDEIYENTDGDEEPVEYDADFLKNLEREHNRLASDDDDVDVENETCHGEDDDDTVKSVKIDDDIEIIEQERETIVIEDEMESSKWNYIGKMEKSTKKVYGPLAVCKNPDFNQRLRRFTAGFMMIPRNRSLLNQCVPCTIDLVNYQAISVPKNITTKNDKVKPSGSGTMDNLPEEDINEVRVKTEKASPEKIDKSVEGKRIMPSRQSKFRSMTVPYPAPKRGTKTLSPKPLQEIAPKPLQEIAPKPLQEIAPKPLQKIAPKPLSKKSPVLTIPLMDDDARNDVLAIRVDSKGQLIMRSKETKNMRAPASLTSMKKTTTPSRPWWYQSPNTERDFGETTLGIDTLQEILESLSETTDKICNKPHKLIMKKHRNEQPCCYMRRDMLRYSRRATNKQPPKVVHIHSKINCHCCCKDEAEKLDPNSFLFLELAPSINPTLEGLTVEMVSANPDPADEIEQTPPVITTASVTATPAATASKEKEVVNIDRNPVPVPETEVTRGNKGVRGRARGNSRARNVASRGGTRNISTKTLPPKAPLTDVMNPAKPQHPLEPPPLSHFKESNETIATVSLGPSVEKPVFNYVVLPQGITKTMVNSMMEPVATEPAAENRNTSSQNHSTKSDEELNSDDDVASDDEYLPGGRRKKRTTTKVKTYPAKPFKFLPSLRKNENIQETIDAVAAITGKSDVVSVSDVLVTFVDNTNEAGDKRNVLEDLLQKSGISFEDGLESEMNVSQITSTKDLHIEVSPTTSRSKEESGLDKSSLDMRGIERRKLKNGQEYLYKKPKLLPELAPKPICDTIDLTDTIEEPTERFKQSGSPQKQKILPKVFISSKDLLQMGLKPGVISTKVLLEKGLPVTKKNLNNVTSLPNILKKSGLLVARDNSKVLSVVKNSSDCAVVSQLKTVKSPAKGKYVFVKPTTARKRRRPTRFPNKGKDSDEVISLIDVESLEMVEEYLDDTLDLETSDDESLANLAKRKKLEKVSRSNADDNSQSSVESDISKEPVIINLESDESQDSKKSSGNDISVKSPQIFMDMEETLGNDDPLTESAQKSEKQSENSRSFLIKPGDKSPQNLEQSEDSSRNTFGTNDEIYSYIVMSPGSPQDDETDGNAQNDDQTSDNSGDSQEDFESTLPCHLVQNPEGANVIPNGQIVDL